MNLYFVCLMIFINLKEIHSLCLSILANDFLVSNLGGSLFNFYSHRAGSFCWPQPRVGLVLPLQESLVVLCSPHWLWRIRRLAKRIKDHFDR